MLLAASKADSAVENAVSAGEPAHVARYAFQLAQAFSNFYQKYPVIHEENREKKVFLLWMTAFFRRQLERTAAILGIPIPGVYVARPPLYRRRSACTAAISLVPPRSAL